MYFWSCRQIVCVMGEVTGIRDMGDKNGSHVGRYLTPATTVYMVHEAASGPDLTR